MAALEARTRHNLLCYEHAGRILDLPEANMFLLGWSTSGCNAAVCP
ncbi:MAG: hypothetical protein WDO74_12975 [Pseudomonadota bacterium]